MDGNETPEDAFRYHFGLRENTLVSVFCVGKQPLDGDEIAARDNGFVMVPPNVLVAVFPVFLRFVVQIIGGKGFPGEDIPAVPFVLENAEDASCGPYGIAFFGFAAGIGQDTGNLRAGITIQVKEENKTDNPRFFFVDGKVPVLVPVIAKEGRGEEDAAFEAHFYGCVHDFAFVMAFFLRERGEEGKAEIIAGIQGINVFRFKKYADGGL